MHVPAQDFGTEFIYAINKVRNEGCRCAGKRMPRVGQVSFNRQLELSAYTHAKEILRQRRLNHYSREGLDIGQRIDQVGYKWLVVGENLAYGQESIQEVITDWIKSKSHCYLLMDRRFDEVGFAKVGPYWVLHFGKQK